MVRFFVANNLDEACQILDNNSVRYDLDIGDHIIVGDEDATNVEYLFDKHLTTVTAL